jgi:alcohol-forming fatty acyl-CoA reductase
VGGGTGTAQAEDTGPATKRGSRAARKEAKPKTRPGGTWAVKSSADSGIAFFDFDNTLISGDAGPLFGWYLFLWRRHELERRPLKRLRLWLRYLPFATWMGLQAVFYKLGAVRRSTIVRAAYKGLRGVEEERFLGLMQQFAAEAIVPRIFPAMREEVRRHHEAGRRTVVVTTGIESLVRHVLDSIEPGMDLIGCRMRTRQRKGKRELTGKVDGPLFGVDKANILDAYARALGVDPKECWAYSDHLSDRQMLEAVGHPVAVNPRGRLRRLARRRGWTVLEPKL